MDPVVHFEMPFGDRDRMARVFEAGGTVLGEPMEIRGVGQYAGFMDPEGNRVSLLQPLPMNASGS